MAPIKTYSNWNKSSRNADKRIDPYRRYYFICEGKNTERWYFEKLIDIRKTLSIHSNIEVAYLEKTGEDKNISNPKSLIELADAQKRNGKIKFDPKHDKMIVVFDADIFESQQNNYDEILELGEKNNILGITNPSFELFLLLHYANSVDEIIIPNSKNIMKNDWVGKKQNKRRYIEDVFRKRAKMRPKSNNAIGELASNVLVAIDQEGKINNDIVNCKGKLTSNIGGIIQSIIDDQCND
jgi:uncharacterized protein YuzE